MLGASAGNGVKVSLASTQGGKSCTHMLFDQCSQAFMNQGCFFTDPREFRSSLYKVVLKDQICSHAHKCVPFIHLRQGSQIRAI